jgi:hypothetical protein
MCVLVYCVKEWFGKKGYGRLEKTQQIDKQLIAGTAHAHALNEIKKTLTILCKKWINNILERINGAGAG